MKETLRLLVRIQELEYVLLEQDGFEDPAKLSELDETIRDLRAELPDDIDSLYERLKQRGAPTVAIALDGTCSACSMRMPTSQGHAVRVMETLERCQSCSRILYDPGIVPRQLKGMPPQQRTGIDRFTSAALMHPRLEATTAEQAIAELAKKMAALELVSNRTELVESALRRERLTSTALGNGIAIPHVRGVEGGGLTFSLGLKKDGFVFDPESEELTRIVFFFLVPTTAGNSFLEVLGGLVGAFRESGVRDRLLKCSDADTLLAELTALTKDAFR